MAREAHGNRQLRHTWDPAHRQPTRCLGPQGNGLAGPLPAGWMPPLKCSLARQAERTQSSPLLPFFLVKVQILVFFWLLKTQLKRVYLNWETGI